jgi:methionyl-tRNA formyltransferase
VQSTAGVTYAAKLDKREATSTGSNAVAIDRMIRAFDPTPGASSTLGAKTVKLWRAEPLDGTAVDPAPGTILEATRDGVVVACGSGRLRVTELQPAGSRRMDAAAFAAGRQGLRGARFGVPRQASSACGGSRAASG